MRGIPPPRASPKLGICPCWGSPMLGIPLKPWSAQVWWKMIPLIWLSWHESLMHRGE